MTRKQKRIIAYALALLGLVASLLLWSGVVRSQVSPDVPPKESPHLPAAPVQEDVAVHGIARASTLQPSLHFAASSESRDARDSETAYASPSAELLRWEVHPAYAISIPALHVRAPVLLPSTRYWNAKEWDMLERQMQTGLAEGAVAYPHSVRPGTVGTIVIAGHSSPPTDQARKGRYGDLFAELPSLVAGDQIILRAGDRSVTYEVLGGRVVPAGDTSVLAQQEGVALLTLITCYPVGSTRDRFVITARKVGE